METRDQRQNLWCFSRRGRAAAPPDELGSGVELPCDADALVVLGCTVGPSGEPSAALSRRLSTALDAFRTGVAPRIVVAGGRRWGSHSEAECMQRWLVDRGVPASRVLWDLCSLTTLENAVYCRELAQLHGLRRLTLVTCDFHMQRALAAFRRVGLDCDPLPARTPGGVRWSRRLLERARALVDGFGPEAPPGDDADG